MSDIESILDDLERCQEESSVDPETPDDIPIDSESRALSLDKKRNTRINSQNSPKFTQVDGHALSNSTSYSPFINNNTFVPPEVQRVTGNTSGLTPNGFTGTPLGSSPIRVSDHLNGSGLWGHPTAMAKSPVVDRASYQFPSHFRDNSDSLASESSSTIVVGSKTPGSIHLMQQTCEWREQFA